VSLAVDRILERRARAFGRPATASVVAAFLLHGFFVALALVLPRLTPPPPPPSFVPVTILPAQALGVRRPASRPKPEKPAPEPEKPAPEPAEPEPEPEREEAPVLPTEDEEPEKPKPAPTPRDTLPKPARETPKKPEPPKPSSGAETGSNPAGTAAQGDPEGETGRRGDAGGNPLGTTAFGSAIAGIDSDFKFGYYIDQLLGAIDSKWNRPAMGDDVRTIISFRIGRDGRVSDLEVAESSGYNSFDLAALRAVQNAAPFPPLPRGYRKDTLDVKLIVR
jgi:TonB family protein